MARDPLQLAGSLRPHLYQAFQQFKSAGEFDSDAEALNVLLELFFNYGPGSASPLWQQVQTLEGKLPA